MGAESVRLQGENVIGRWTRRLGDFTGLRGRLLAEDFVNWPSDPDEIVRFTAMYAPLSAHPHELPQEGNEFQFSLSGWRKTQARLRMLWEGRAGKSDVSFTTSGARFDISVQGRNVVLYTKALEDYLVMELAIAPAERLRKCLRPDCPNPYFVARHLKQQYCSPACAEWAQAQWKKKWWDDRGTKWLNDKKAQKAVGGLKKRSHRRTSSERRKG